jgi:uncharacterized delta-60 repeat protein
VLGDKMNEGLKKKSTRRALPSYWMVLGGCLVLSLAINLAGPGYLTAAPVAPMNTARCDHTAILLTDGRVLVAGGFNNTYRTSAEIYNPATNAWTYAASMHTARGLHTATLLANGRVLVAGGFNGGAVPSVEIYDPDDNTWTVAASLTDARYNHTATLLSDGRVMVAGGFTGTSMANIEIYDPEIDTWSLMAGANPSRDRHTATLMSEGRVLVAGGNDGSITASAKIYDPGTNTWTSVGNLQRNRENHTATLLMDGQVLVVGGNDTQSQLGISEIYSPTSKSWVLTAYAHHAREHHSATLLPDGKVLITGGYFINSGYLVGTEIFNPADGRWYQALNLNLNTGRNRHTATLLPDGRVLVVGGNDGTSLSSVEILDLNVQSLTASFTGTAALNTARSGHTATLLADGRVLAAGGNYNGAYLSAAEIYNPAAANAWTPAAALNTSRSFHTATLLPDGRILVTGGQGPGDAFLAAAEWYDPAANAWNAVAAMNAAHSGHTATLLPYGRVLVSGGYPFLDAAEIFDPPANAWTATAKMKVERSGHTATLLPDGRVLAVGGHNASGNLNSTEIYDPTANAWTLLANLNTGRDRHTTTLLPDGRVLTVGGYRSGYLANAELYNPGTNTWTATAAMNTGRADHTATLLPDGRVLAVGGFNNLYLDNAEIFSPATNTWTSTHNLNTARSGQTATLLPDGRVLTVGGYRSGYLASAEVFDRGLGYQPDWRPLISNIPLSFSLGSPLTLTGFGFRGFGFSEASGGSTNSSATNYPIVQILRLDNEQLVRLEPGAPFTPASFTSKPVNSILPGPAMVTVLVNAIPSISKYVHLTYETAISITTSQSSVTYGTTITFSSIVTSGGGTPIGTVQFRVDGTDYGNPVPLAGGVANFSIASLSAGAHQVSAKFMGDLNFNGADTALPVNQVVTQAATTVTLTTSQNSAPLGTRVTFTATVTSGGGTSTGTVQFRVDGTDYEDPVPLVGGVAAISTALLSLGKHDITAVYSGDLNFKGSSTTSPLIQEITPRLFLPLIMSFW